MPPRKGKLPTMPPPPPRRGTRANPSPSGLKVLDKPKRTTRSKLQGTTNASDIAGTAPGPYSLIAASPAFNSIESADTQPKPLAGHRPTTRSTTRSVSPSIFQGVVAIANTAKKVKRKISELSDHLQGKVAASEKEPIIADAQSAEAPSSSHHDRYYNTPSRVPSRQQAAGTLTIDEPSHIHTPGEYISDGDEVNSVNNYLEDVDTGNDFMSDTSRELDTIDIDESRLSVSARSSDGLYAANNNASTPARSSAVYASDNYMPVESTTLNTVKTDASYHTDSVSETRNRSHTHRDLHNSYRISPLASTSSNRAAASNNILSAQLQDFSEAHSSHYFTPFTGSSRVAVDNDLSAAAPDFSGIHADDTTASFFSAPEFTSPRPQQAPCAQILDQQVTSPYQQVATSHQPGSSTQHKESNSSDNAIWNEAEHPTTPRQQSTTLYQAANTSYEEDSESVSSDEVTEVYDPIRYGMFAGGFDQQTRKKKDVQPVALIKDKAITPSRPPEPVLKLSAPALKQKPADNILSPKDDAAIYLINREKLGLNVDAPYYNPRIYSALAPANARPRDDPQEDSDNDSIDMETIQPVEPAKRRKIVADHKKSIELQQIYPRVHVHASRTEETVLTESALLVTIRTVAEWAQSNPSSSLPSPAALKSFLDSHKNRQQVKVGKHQHTNEAAAFSASNHRRNDGALSDDGHLQPINNFHKASASYTATEIQKENMCSLSDAEAKAGAQHASPLTKAINREVEMGATEPQTPSKSPVSGQSVWSTISKVISSPLKLFGLQTSSTNEQSVAQFLQPEGITKPAQAPAARRGGALKGKFKLPPKPVRKGKESIFKLTRQEYVPVQNSGISTAESAARYLESLTKRAEQELTESTEALAAKKEFGRQNEDIHAKARNASRMSYQATMVDEDEAAEAEVGEKRKMKSPIQHAEGVYGFSYDDYDTSLSSTSSSTSPSSSSSSEELFAAPAPIFPVLPHTPHTPSRLRNAVVYSSPSPMLDQENLSFIGFDEKILEAVRNAPEPEIYYV